MDLGNLSNGESVLLGFGVYVLGLIINGVLSLVLGVSIPFLSIALMIFFYFWIVRDSSGSLVYYLVGFFALLIVVLIIAVLLMGALLLFAVL